jgi:short-subunit dehydrogenase
VLINNAGYGRYAPFAEIPITEWDRMWAVNVRGAILVTQAVLQSMIDNQNGHIVNISSVHGIHTAANATAYCATKHALNGFSEALAKEVWLNGIKVSTINPGGVLTPFLGIPPESKNQEFLDPEDVAGVALDVVCASPKTLVLHTVVAPRTRPFVVQEIS